MKGSTDSAGDSIAASMSLVHETSAVSGGQRSPRPVNLITGPRHRHVRNGTSMQICGRASRFTHPPIPLTLPPNLASFPCTFDPARTQTWHPPRPRPHCSPAHRHKSPCPRTMSHNMQPAALLASPCHAPDMRIHTCTCTSLPRPRSPCIHAPHGEISPATLAGSPHPSRVLALRIRAVTTMRPASRRVSVCRAHR